MLHPVLPPALPPIAEALQPANPTLSASDTKFKLSVAADTGTQSNQENSQPQQATPQPATVGEKSQPQPDANKLMRDRLVVSPNLSKPNPPTTFPPEFSPLNAPMSAALLGQPMGIAYPIQNDSSRPEALAAMSTTGYAYAPNATNNQN
ncbi:MAG: DUF3769 domain-containing protein, partial [Aulosira sp. DedQUE10]|nr:DUF3769 domain-containing protein [Aulosira sp. DedQUE10]